MAPSLLRVPWHLRFFSFFFALFTMTPPSHSANSASASSFSTPNHEFLTLSVGRSGNAIDLVVPSAPAVHCAAALKASAFDYASDLLLSHLQSFSSAELIAAFRHIPSNSYNAGIEATAISQRVSSAFFSVDNLVGLGFRDSAGQSVASTGITADVTGRPTGLSFFAFRSTVNPSLIDPRIKLPATTFDFLLSLPQTTVSSVTPPIPDGRRNLLPHFSTPTTSNVSPAPAPVAPALITLAALNALDPADRAAIGSSTSTDKLSDYDADCLPAFSKDELIQLVLRNSISASLSTAAPSPPPPAVLVSPRMSAVLAADGSSEFTYRGSLDFLELQSCFDTVFPHPTPSQFGYSNSSSVLDTNSIPTAISCFVDQCKFVVFVPIFRTDYVGTADRNDATSLQATVRAIKDLRMSSRDSTTGKWINITPDDLYHQYSLLTPLLPSNVALWGFNLVSQFQDALSPDLLDALLQDKSYSAPALSTLITRSDQLSALRTVRAQAVDHHLLIKSHERIVNRAMTRRFKGNPSSATAAHFSAVIAPPPLSALPTQAQSFMSPAESTMNRYAPTPTVDPNLPKPIDPLTGHQSPFPAGFSGCMLCGSNDHVFSGCPNREANGAKQTFFRNLFAHKPNLRKSPPKPYEIVPGFVPAIPLAPPVQAFNTHAPYPTPPYPSSQHPALSHPLPPFPVTYPVAPSTTTPPFPTILPSVPPTPSVLTVDPSLITPPHLAPPATPTIPAHLATPPSTAPTNTPKKARFFVNVVKTFQNHAISQSPALPPMPIAIDNGLPHVHFELGKLSSDVVLSGLADTCGALNTGYKRYHQYIMSEHPEIVHEYLEFDSSTPFEPIRLGGAIIDKADLVESSHGHLTAIIRYFTPYTGIDGSNMIISFALGDDVSVNTIFGLTFLKNLDAQLCLGSNTLKSSYLQCDFPIHYCAVEHGLPTGTHFDPAQFARNHAGSDFPALLSRSPSSVAGSATAIDDSSAGFLRRSLHPTV
jgi:hypothetical protein